MEQTALTDLTQTTQTLDTTPDTETGTLTGEAAVIAEQEYQAGMAEKARQQEAQAAEQAKREAAPKPPADAPAPLFPAQGTNPPVGTPVSEAEKAAVSVPDGLDADPNTAGRVDESQAQADRENEAGYRGVRTDPTPHSHYTVAGVTSGKPTPETNAAAAMLTGNAARYADLSEDERQEHYDADGVDEIAKRAHKLGYRG